MSRVVSFRAEDPLYARLHEFAQRSSLSEGQAALFLVDTGLGRDPRSAAVATYMRALSARMKSPIRDAIKRISADLERFARTFEAPAGYERVEEPLPVEEGEEEELPPSPEEETMSAEEAAESGLFDREEPEEPPAGTQGVRRRRGRRGGKR